KKLSEKLGDLRGKHISVLGLAFKPGTDDVREAPSLDIINYLVDEGAIVSATDPLALENARTYLAPTVRLSSDPYDALRGAEAFLLATEWPQLVSLDWKRVKTIMQKPYLVIDGRNVLDAKQLIELGYQYCGFGRGLY
ncbi:MAG: UDP binding domain-containing protein, partial [Candidatus Saccharicenans sp.]